MKKYGKMSVIAAFTLALTLLASVVTPSFANAADENTTSGGFVSNAVEIAGENEALSGWQYYFYNNTLQWYYQSNELFVRATENGRTGNAMEIERKKSSDELWVYSYSFDVEPSTNYNISAYVKISDAAGKLVWCVKELDENGADVLDSTTGGAAQYIDRHSVSGVLTEWTETSFTRKTEATTKKIILRIRAEGTGIIDIDDLTVAKTVAPNTISYRMQGIGKGVDGANDAVGDNGQNNFYVLTKDNICEDSSDGDNASLLLNDNEIFKTNFSMLEQGKKYTLSFKYKMLEAGSQNRLSIRLNYCEVGKTDQKYYVDGASGGNASSWTSFSYDFTAYGDGTFGIAIWSFAKYAIDELKITCQEADDNMQYIVNGSFSGAYLEGYTFGDNFNVAKQDDGSSAFVVGNGSFDDCNGGRGYFIIPVEGLTEGKEYTINYDFRFNGASWVNSSLIYLNGAEIKSYTGAAKSWTSESVTFTATGNDKIQFYGPGYYFWATYYRNIRVTDGDGKVYNVNADLVAPDKDAITAYSSDFGTGNAEYTWKDWTIENGGIYGFVYEEGKNEYKICLDGSADKTATAISKDIDVTGVNVLKIEQKIYYFGGNLAVTLLAGEKEITADSNGYFILPEGTTSIKVKYAANEYVTFKKVFVNTHAHGEECANVTGEQTNVYEFSADNTTCTATRYYACGAVVKTEKVNTVLSGDTATFTETGTATCTATFEDSGFETQTKTVETPMKETPEVGMKVGASIRTNEPYGIRWTAKIRTADWDKLVTLYGEENVKAGVLVAPFDYVKNGDTVTELTVEAFKAAGLNYVDIVTDTFNADAGKGMEGYNAFYASLVNIQTANLNRRFIARAYIAVENNGVTTYYYGEYSEENQARSIYEISKKVIVSETESGTTKQFAKTGVLDKVVEVTVENGEATLATIEGYASPYTVTLENGVLTISVANAESGANISNIGIVCVNGKNYKPTVSGDVVTVSIN